MSRGGLQMKRERRPHVVEAVLAAVLAGAAAHSDARAVQPLADVKFSSPRHQVVVQVKLGKQGPFAMLLDTGTDRSVIDAALASRLGAISGATAHPGKGKGGGLEPARTGGWNMIGLRLGHLRADT